MKSIQALASLIIFGLIAFISPALALAEDEIVGSDEYAGAYNYSGAYEDAKDTATDSSAFDGGDGSTLNTSAESYPLGDVPDIGESGPVEE